MKENIKIWKIKKESLKKLSRKNLLDIVLIMFLEASILTLKLSLFLLFIYSVFTFSFTQNLFFYLNGFKESNQIALIVSSFALMFLSIIFYFPLNLGIKRWFYGLNRSSKRPLHEIFYYYSNIKLFVKSTFLKLSCIINFLLTVSLPLILSFSLFIIACINIQISKDNSTLFEILFIVSSILIFLSILFSCKTLLSYTLTSFLFASTDPKKVYKTIKSSRFLFNTNKKLFYRFYISSVPSYILSALLIPCVFTSPYLCLSLLELTKEITYKQNQGIETIPLTEKVIDISKELLV